MSKVSVSAAILQEWKASNGSFEASYVQAPGSKPVTIGEGDYKVIQIPLKDGSGTFPKVEFTLEGDTTRYSFNLRGGKAPNMKMPVKIAKFVASRDHACSNGTTLLKGKTNWFAYQS